MAELQFTISDAQLLSLHAAPCPFSHCHNFSYRRG